MGFYPVVPGGGGGGATTIATIGPPTSGTGTLGKMVIDINGYVWICTVAGSPGTWLPAATKNSPDLPPAGLTYDYEFNATTTSLPSGWSWYNQGAATYSESLGGGVINCPNNATPSIRGIYKAMPSAPFTVTAKLKSAGSSASNANTGILFTDTTGAMLFGTAGGNASNIRALTCDHYTNATTYQASVAGGGPTSIADPQYIQVVYTSNTNVSYFVSSDGLNWFTPAAGINLTSLYSFTPTQIGIFANSYNNYNAIVTAHWFRTS